MFYKKIARPLFFQLDPERAHETVLHGLQLASKAPWFLKIFTNLTEGSVPQKPRIVAGITFPNPVGLAAGMDKNGVALLAWEALGFGFIEIGTITAHAQPGNPKPRLFRFPEQEALINRLGFNNEGAHAVATRLKNFKDHHQWPKIPVGINIGKSRITPVEEAANDYLTSYRELHGLGDYYVLNVSSPNTPGLRNLQAKEALATIIKTIRDWESTPLQPLFVKVAPDLAPEDLENIITLAEQEKISGLIATNTTLDHFPIPQNQDETGGLSGKPLQARSLQTLQQIRKQTSLPVIACGGIHDKETAEDRFKAGADLLQIYTSLIYQGPGVIRKLLRK